MDTPARGVVAARVARVSDVACGALVFALAMLKLPLLGLPDAPIASLGAGAVEVGIAGVLLAGWRPGLGAALLVGLGAATTAWTALKALGVVSAGPCGCFGLHRPSDLAHGLVAASLLFAGGWQTYLLSVRRGVVESAAPPG